MRRTQPNGSYRASTSALALVLTAGFAACSIPRADAPTPTDPTSTDGALFPHPATYAQPDGHGADALSRGTIQCIGCHEATTEAPEPNGAPACAHCHAQYPHETGPDETRWSLGAAHGPAATDLEQGATCAGCHDAPTLTASTEFSCTTCHASYPHPAGWEGRGEHGRYAADRGDGRAVCGACHGDDLAGGRIDVSCTQCHLAWPHPSGWQDRSAHGAAASADPSVCAGCHADAADPTAWTGGSAELACSSCHAAYPHDADWGRTHLERTATLGEGVCMGCHTPAEGPATVPATCAPRCHGGVTE
jgi:hypothetical protein